MKQKDFAEALSESERRNASRKKLVVNVQFSDGDATGIANTRDIGIGGLYMTTSTRLDIGTPLSMHLSLGVEELTLDGVVVYSDPGHGVGIRFQELTETDEQYLRDALDIRI